MKVCLRGLPHRRPAALSTPGGRSLGLAAHGWIGGGAALHRALLMAGPASVATATVSRRGMHSQRDTPIVPQARVAEPTDEAAAAAAAKIGVGYLLLRQPVVKPDPHPLEHEWSFTLDRELARYARHADESATAFFSSRGMSLDSWGRQDPKQISANFYNLELYQDAAAAVANRYHPPLRLQKADFYDPCDPGLQHGPPTRHTINRRLSDFLVLIVRSRRTGRWSIPFEARQREDSLRLSLDRMLASHHGVHFETYCHSNCPNAVVALPSLPPSPNDRNVVDGTPPKGDVAEGNKNGGDDTSLDLDKLFIFNVTYLSGRPTFDKLNTGFGRGVSDHAWVTRAELNQYEFDLGGDAFRDVLRDIAPDAYMETP